MSFIRTVNALIVKTCNAITKAFDGTGINMSHRSRHYEKRAKLDYLPNGKLDILADIENFIIEDWHFAVRERHDVLAAKRMMKRAKKCAAEIWADKAYDCEELHQLTHDKGGILLARTRASSRKRPKGRFRKKVNAIIEAREKYERPKIETVFSILKKVYGETIRAILPHMKKREMAWKIVAMNIEKIAAKLLLYFCIQTIRNRAGGT